jgi:alanine racemase
MTHFARADERDGIAEQIRVFEDACGGLPYPRSLANSAGVVRFREVGGDIVRPGIMLIWRHALRACECRAAGIAAR